MLTSRCGQPRSSRRAHDAADGADSARSNAGKAVGQVAVADVEVDRVDDEPILARQRDRLVELLGVDAELGRSAAAVERLVVAAPGRAGARVDAQADRRPRRAPPEAADLAEQVEVHVHAVREDHVEVALGDVGARVADLVGVPAVSEAVQQLAGGAHVEADAAGRPGAPRLRT